MEKRGKHFPGKPSGKGRVRVLAGALALALLTPALEMIFANAAPAPEEPSPSGLCVHHPAHTEDCGWRLVAEGELCTHEHDGLCGWTSAVEEVPCDKNCGQPVPEEEPQDPLPGGEEGEPQEPAEPQEAAPDQQDPGEPQADQVVHQPDCAYTPAEEGTPCTHVHDEACGGLAHTEPCRYVCPWCVSGWEWEDGEDLLTWNGDANLWGLGLPGASPEEPVTREVLEALLPGSIAAQTPAGPASVGLSWDLSALPEEGAWEGSFTLRAALTGEYALTPEAPALEVLVELGGGEMLDEKRKFLNQWCFISRDGSKMEYDNNYQFHMTAALPELANLKRDEIINRLKDETLPQTIRGWTTVADSDNVFGALGFFFDEDQDEKKFETSTGKEFGDGYKWGRINIEWDVTSFPATFEDGKTYSIRAKMPTKTLNGNAYNIYVNSNNIKDYEEGGPGGDTRTNSEILTLYVTIRDLNLSDHTVPPASPDNVTVNLFDYWVKTENPTAPDGDKLTKKDSHYHEDGSEGALSTTATGYSAFDDWHMGINDGHLLLFGDGMIHAGLWNKGAGENCRYGKKYAGMEGIVNNTLTAGWPELNLKMAKGILTGDGTEIDADTGLEKYKLIKDYALTGDHVDKKGTNGTDFDYTSENIQNLSNTLIQAWGGDIENDTESLQYLFDPDADHANKTTYTDVKGLFQLDNDGYYYYNMRQNFAEFLGDGNGSGKFVLYDAPATVRTDGKKSIGNFFPFNSAAEVFNGIDANGKLTSTVSQSGNTMNHHLGMTVDVDFLQPVGGKIGTGQNAENMTFGFSGDDDVWVFIDDVLVLDLGGIHSELYGTIDFATGDVYIGRAFGVNGVPKDPADTSIMVTHTTLRQLYEAALGVDNPALANERWNGSTFASNTSHKLRMFYLERGNYDSSIALRFNLQPLLPQRIVKVDQDGQPVSGVEFDLYPAEVADSPEGAIPCLYTDSDEGDRQPFYVKQTSAEDGKPLVSLKTGEDGSAEFITNTGASRAENTYFNFADRGKAYYILKEKKQPDGYRKQPVDIVLHYDTDTSMLSVANRWTTGAYACSVSNVTGPVKLKEGSWNPDAPQKGEDVTQEEQAGGLVLTVPLLKKKSGDRSWMALHGSNLTKFTAEPLNTENGEAWAILLAALEQAQDPDAASWCLDWDAENHRLSGRLYDLPGLASRYLLNNPKSGDMHMVYGILSPAALNVLGVTGDTAEKRYTSLRTILKEKTREELKELCSQALGTSNGFRFLNVDQFSRTFRSLIYIPNERRELHVQKVDQDGKPVEGAEFTLYKDQACTQSVASGTTDKNGLLVFSPSGTNTPGSAKMEWAANEADPAVAVAFYLQETQAPAGHQINSTVIPIQLGTYGIYADAGKKEDGVSVMAGVGKLTQTMRQYADGGDVDITLQDITAVMQTQASGGFRMDGWTDDKLEGTQVLRGMNLHFGLNAVIDYGLHDQDGGKLFKPFFVTDTGYVRARVMQNYDALTGKLYENPNPDANMDNLSGLDLTNLFSLLNMVVVTDQTEPDTDTGRLTIRKKVTDTTAQEDFTKLFSFTVELRNSDGSQLGGSYQYYFYGEDKAGDLETGEKLLLHHDEAVTILGLPEGTRVTVTEENPGSGWYVTPSPAVYTCVIEKDGDFQAEFTNSRKPTVAPPTDPPSPPVVIVPPTPTPPTPTPSPSPSPGVSPSPSPDISPSPSPGPSASPGPDPGGSPRPTATPRPTLRPGETPNPDDDLDDPNSPTGSANPDGATPTPKPTPTPNSAAKSTPKPSSNPPATGDGGTGLWLTLAVVSGLGLIGLYVLRKRKK